MVYFSPDADDMHHFRGQFYRGLKILEIGRRH